MMNSAVLFRNPVVVLREEFDEWAVLYNPDSADAIGINPIGVAVWKTVDGQRTRDDVVQVVLEGYDAVPVTAAEEVTSFIEKLVEGGFLAYQVEMLAE